MREIKFRAWDKEEDKMSIIYFINWFCNKCGIEIHGKKRSVPLDNVKLMQYTGLKDKNDKEIYEGDIVNYTDGEFTRRKGQIEFDYFGFMLSEIITNNREYPQIGLLGEIEDFEEFGFEIIGNIYENPELLKE